MAAASPGLSTSGLENHRDVRVEEERNRAALERPLSELNGTQKEGVLRLRLDPQNDLTV